MSTLIEPWHALGLAPWSIFFSSQNLSHLPLIYVPSMQRCREMIIFADFIHDVLSLYLKVPVGFSPIRCSYYFFRLMMPMKVFTDKTLSLSLSLSLSLLTYLWFPPRVFTHNFFSRCCLWWLISFSDLTKNSVARINRITIWHYSILKKLKQCPSFL